MIFVFKLSGLVKGTQGHGCWQEKVVAGTDGAESIFSLQEEEPSELLTVAGRSRVCAIC